MLSCAPHSGQGRPVDPVQPALQARVVHIELPAVKGESFIDVELEADEITPSRRFPPLTRSPRGTGEDRLRSIGAKSQRRGSQVRIRTRRWREVDSNHRSRAEGPGFFYVSATSLNAGQTTPRGTESLTAPRKTAPRAPCRDQPEFARCRRKPATRPVRTTRAVSPTRADGAGLPRPPRRRAPARSRC